MSLAQALAVRYLQVAYDGGPPVVPVGFEVDFTLTRGTDATPWWSRRGAEVIGSAVGDREIVTGVSIDRVHWNRDGNFRLIFNTDGDPQPWLAGAGANAQLIVHIGASQIVLDVPDIEGQGAWGFRWQLSGSGNLTNRQIADSLSADHDARITIEENP